MIVAEAGRELTILISPNTVPESFKTVNFVGGLIRCVSE